jgi:hypothetical protein
MTQKPKQPDKGTSFSSGNGNAHKDVSPFKGKIVFLHEKDDTATTLATWIAQRSSPLSDHPFVDDLQAGIHYPLSILSDPQKQQQLGEAEQVILAIPEDKVTEFARYVSGSAFHLRFDDRFPNNFCLVHAFPKELFETGSDGASHYIGPSFADLLEPATWATARVRDGVFKLRPAFLGQWYYVDEIDRFVNRLRPTILKHNEALERSLRSLSHGKSKPVDLLLNNFHSKVTRLAYLPGRTQGRINIEGVTCFNVYRPTRIKPAPASIAPFAELLAHLFPEASDRRWVERWIATLIAHPARRVPFGLFLYSETQGTGRNTLTDQVIAPLLSRHNCSWPNETAVLKNDFNEWRVNIRLAIVSEIYSGHGSKMYDMLKDALTDEWHTASLKGISRFRLECLLTVIAITNHYRALIIAKQDRRWLIPKMAEIKLTLDKSTEFRKWLRHGGLSAILHWALNFDEYIAEGTEAPMTAIKQQMIDDAIREVELAIGELAQDLADARDNDKPAPAALAWLTIRDHLRNLFPEEMKREPDATLRIMMAKSMGTNGAWFGTTIKERIYINGRPDYAIGNAALHELVAGVKGEKRSKIIRKHLRTPTTLRPVYQGTEPPGDDKSDDEDNVTSLDERRAQKASTKKDNDN